MAIDGKWWWYFGEELFDVDTTRWLTLADGVATDSTGAFGSYVVEGSGLRIVTPDGDELVVRQALPTSTNPDWLSGYFTNGMGGLVVFAKDGVWAEELTQRNRERAGRYTTIDVSMYPPGAPGHAELSVAETVDDIEGALSLMPKAKFTHA